ncbi:MAG: hypothetical protein ABL889_15425 [Terricaulis sp.]
MTGAPPFQASRIKRARKHIEELKQLQAEWSASIKATYPENGQGFASISIGPAPEETGAAFGDAIHNLRASLDLMAVDLAKANGAEKTSDVYFPFGMDEATFETAIKGKRFDKAGEAAVALIRTFQPYKSGNHALRAIHDLDVEDKHERLLPDAANVATNTVRVHIDDQGKVTLQNEPGLPGPSASFAFPPGYPFESDEVIPTLESLLDLTTSVVEAFAKLIKPGA